MNAYRAVGVMSGSSLDGLDVVLCDFQIDQSWSFEIVAANTYPFPANLNDDLKECRSFNDGQIKNIDLALGDWIGSRVLDLISEHDEPDLVASHGHTVFHQPHLGYTLQIGNGERIARTTGIKTVSNFRSLDVSLGGQGAPLVPAGEKYLFPQYDACVNLGGIANITLLADPLAAYDIAPCNQILNFYSKKLGKPFDNEGIMAQSGRFLNEWHDQLKEIEYFNLKPPKSLSNEWVQNTFLDNSPEGEPSDYLFTFCEFLSDQIAMSLSQLQTVLITGGGTHNSYLIDRIRSKTDAQIVIPEQVIVDFKEALIFAFLGVLKLRNEVNVFSSVTGASRDSVSGEIHI